MGTHQFGGDWTNDKLDRLRRYLIEYRKIFDKNTKARFFNTIYVDAFAGTGERADTNRPNEETNPSRQGSLFDLTGDYDAYSDTDYQSIQQGSVRVVLDLASKFNQYIFVEKKKEFVQQLEVIKSQYADLNISIEHQDSNVFLQSWCGATDWESNRAVLFLDPYGMQVEWSTIQAIAATKAIDLWLWFPLGQAVNRLLTKKNPSPAYETRLTKMFGTDSWKQAFYTPSGQMLLFDQSIESKKKHDV